MCNIDKDKCPYYLKSSQKQKNRRLRTLKEKSAKDMNKLHRGKKNQMFLTQKNVLNFSLYKRCTHENSGISCFNQTSKTSRGHQHLFGETAGTGTLRCCQWECKLTQLFWQAVQQPVLSTTHGCFGPAALPAGQTCCGRAATALLGPPLQLDPSHQLHYCVLLWANGSHLKHHHPLPRCPMTMQPNAAGHGSSKVPSPLSQGGTTLSAPFKISTKLDFHKSSSLLG